MGSEAGLLLQELFGKSKSELDESEVVEKSPKGRYVRCSEILGRGASKIVYKGFDVVDGIEIAWNQVSVEHALQSPEHLERLYSEVHLLKTLKHVNIIKSYSSWVDDVNKTINIITELFTSGSLRQYRKKHKSVDIKAIKNWGRQIVKGLCYLHSHSPPIIHRDLKCDNIFVNGNNGEVKIGDLGLATVMHRSTASSVIGTPEFMAPELYDEEYSELVDVYSFGMCMLELVASEYPYSECKNPAQIYKKVTSGVKPAALCKVKDPQVRHFIESCLLPPDMRRSAAELLKDPFLSFENSMGPQLLPNFVSKSTDVLMRDSLAMDIEFEPKKLSVITSNRSASETTRASAVELRRSSGKNIFKLEGEIHDDESISLTLRIVNSCSQVRNIHFIFYLREDTALSIASEMVDQLDLSNEDLTFVTGLIDNLIVKLVPSWKPSLGSSSMVESLYGDSGHENDHSSMRYSWAPWFGDDIFKHHVSTSKTNESHWGANGLSFERCQDSFSGTVVMNEITNSSIDLGSLSICSDYIAGEDHCNELKMELEAINAHYRQGLSELLRMKEEAIERAKRKWTTRKKIPIA